jgi:hypothetical protein
MLAVPSLPLVVPRDRGVALPLLLAVLRLRRGRPLPPLDRQEDRRQLLAAPRVGLRLPRVRHAQQATPCARRESSETQEVQQRPSAQPPARRHHHQHDEQHRPHQPRPTLNQPIAHPSIVSRVQPTAQRRTPPRKAAPDVIAPTGRPDRHRGYRRVRASGARRSVPAPGTRHRNPAQLCRLDRDQRT